MKGVNMEKEMVEWLNLLLDYATGKKEWDTWGPWVCEDHPCMPVDQGLSFDCKCRGAGIAPFRPCK